MLEISPEAPEIDENEGGELGNEEEADDEEDEEKDDDYEEVETEPKLSFSRVVNDVRNILRNDSFSCVAANVKFMILGTFNGKIHLLKHDGSLINGRLNQMTLHSTAVLQISIDDKGEYFVSCSADKVVIFGIFNNDNNVTLNFDRRVHCVAIDPLFGVQGSGRRFIVGSDKITLHERGLFTRYKTNIIYHGGDEIRNIKWRGNYLAWASDDKVRIYDLIERCVISQLNRESSLVIPVRGLYRCCLHWKSDDLLLFGWADNIQICSIKKREPLVVGLPAKTVHTTIHIINSIICGIAYFETNILIISVNIGDERDQLDETESPQLQIQIHDENGQDKISDDILFPHGYQKYKCSDYHLEFLPELSMYIIVCPRDVIIARPRSEDDHIKWLINHERHEEALEAAKKRDTSGLYTLTYVGQISVKYLISLGDEISIEQAAKLCPTVLLQDRAAWLSIIDEFTTVNRLSSLAPHLPNGRFVLDRSVYDSFLEYFLTHNQRFFLRFVREWNCNMFSVEILRDKLISRLNQDPNNRYLLESLGEIHSYMNEHERAVALFIDIQNGERVFNLIRKHSLYQILYDKMEILMTLNAVLTSQLLIDSEITLDSVVEKLRDQPKFFWIYLDLIVEKDCSQAIKYHNLLVRQYAEYAPNKLMAFLRKSNYYTLEEALTVCQRANLVHEAIFLLSKMGKPKEALLQIFLLQDIDYAIEFCREHDDKELWDSLKSFSLKKPEHVRSLLANIATDVPDPIGYIRSIPREKKISGLKDTLINVLSDYKLKISLEECCKRVVTKECFDLFQNLNDMRKKPTKIDCYTVCVDCEGKIISPEKPDIIIFNCHHIYHKQCAKVTDFGAICKICVISSKRTIS